MSDEFVFGSCKALYGVIGRTATELFDELSKSFDSIGLVRNSENQVDYCDLVIVDTVATLIQSRSYINSNMIVIVCDSIINVEKLSTVHPLDYVGSSIESLALSPMKTKLLRLRKPLSMPVKISMRKLNHVDESVKAVLNDGFLAEFNSITSNMNKPARRMLRIKLVEHIRKGTSDIIPFLKTFMTEEIVESFENKLKSSYFSNLSKAINASVAGMTINDAKKRFDIRDGYEISYLVRMLEEDQ